MRRGFACRRPPHEMMIRQCGWAASGRRSKYEG
jgi:hypothetical protein